MNQILVSEKIYVTPEMKKKKKIFRFEFIVSVFFLCILSTYAVCAEYDRNKNEQVSKEILNSMSAMNSGAIDSENNIMVVTLNEAAKEVERVTEAEKNVNNHIEIPPEQKFIANDGTEYYSIGTINIPSINVYYPILSTTTTELLKISPCKFWGPNPNETGNFCIVGHNYKNSKFFSNVPNLENGDIIEITDLSGKTVIYMVYDKFIVNPDELYCTNQLTKGKKEITLITCTNDSTQRYIIKAREF